MLAADRANAYVDAEQPWKLAEAGRPPAAARLQAVASVALDLFRQLAVYSPPCCRASPHRRAAWSAARSARWDESQRPLTRALPSAPSPR